MKIAQPSIQTSFYTAVATPLKQVQENIWHDMFSLPFRGKSCMWRRWQCDHEASPDRWGVRNMTSVAKQQIMRRDKLAVTWWPSRERRMKGGPPWKWVLACTHCWAWTDQQKMNETWTWNAEFSRTKFPRLSAKDVLSMQNVWSAYKVATIFYQTYHMISTTISHVRFALSRIESNQNKAHTHSSHIPYTNRVNVHVCIDGESLARCTVSAGLLLRSLELTHQTAPFR